MVFTAVRLIRTGTPGTHLGQENNLHTKRPNTLTQTAAVHPLFSCTRAADHTLCLSILEFLRFFSESLIAMIRIAGTRNAPACQKLSYSVPVRASTTPLTIAAFATASSSLVDHLFRLSPVLKCVEKVFC